MNIFYRIAKTIGIETKHDLRQKLAELEEESRKKAQNYDEILGQKQKEIESCKSISQDLERKLRESDELAEIILRDNELAEAEIERLKLENNNRKYHKKLSDLNEAEIKILCSYIPKNTSAKKPEDKISYRKTHPSDPPGFEKFLEKLAECKYVDDIYGLGQTRRDAKGISFDRVRKEHRIFIIEGLYSLNNVGKPFIIYTTAKNEEEAHFIMHLLNNQFSK